MSGPGSRKRWRLGSGGAWESIPEVVIINVFALLPVEEVLKSCALVCKAWRGLAGDEALWRQLCEDSGLQGEGGRRVVGGWKALFRAVFRNNLVASPHFERIHHMDASLLKAQPLMRCEAKHRLLFDRIYWEDEAALEEFQSFSHWAPDGGCLFQQGGGDGVVREQPPSGSTPCPAAPSRPVIATSREWGKLQQSIGLQAFSATFLDASPPLMLSVWFGGRHDADGVFRVQLLLRDESKSPLAAWDSGELRTNGPHWKEARRLIRGYPQGLRSIIVKIGGKCLTPKPGFYGAKFTAVKLVFLRAREVASDTKFEKLGKLMTLVE